MENLNAEREQITSSNNDLYDYVKRIVAAVKYKGDGGHEDVPSILRMFAKGYEQKIFELENRLKECENGYAGTLHLESNKLHDAEERVKELTEENKMLEAEIQLRNMLISDASNQIEEIRADTVREFAERFKELMGNEFASCGYCNAVGYWSVQSVKKCIDRIADEILNGKE